METTRRSLPVISRRALLTGLVASVPSALSAASLTSSIRPRLRGNLALGPGVQTVADIFAQNGLAARTGFALRDLQSGRMLEVHQPEMAQPPASVAKVATTLYALNALGAKHRFDTRIIATGPIASGRVQGDLWLVGGGDPHLDSDGLADLVAQVVRAGVHGVTGNFYVSGISLPYHHDIDPDQPDHAGYNPAISGLNLNFNRVYFQWKRLAQGYDVSMSAKGTKFDAPIGSIGMRIIDRPGPVLEYRSLEGHDNWSVAANSLGQQGSRWLPVRSPSAYAGEAFGVLGAAQNLRLPGFRIADRHPPEGRELARTSSAPLDAMLASMLRYSTNLTAEVVGLRAAQAGGTNPASIAQSGAKMSAWLHARYGLRGAKFVNHSGLSAESAISAAEMVQLLDIAAQDTLLPNLLKRIDMSGEGAISNVNVRAKTGTMNFTRGLAGYMNGGGRRLGFAIFTADRSLRASAGRAERPRGARTWSGVARKQEQALLVRWARQYLS